LYDDVIDLFIYLVSRLIEKDISGHVVTKEKREMKYFTSTSSTPKGAIHRGAFGSDSKIFPKLGILSLLGGYCWSPKEERVGIIAAGGFVSLRTLFFCLRAIFCPRKSLIRLWSIHS